MAKIGMWSYSFSTPSTNAAECIYTARPKEIPKPFNEFKV